MGSNKDRAMIQIESWLKEIENTGTASLEELEDAYQCESVMCDYRLGDYNGNVRVLIQLLMDRKITFFEEDKENNRFVPNWNFGNFRRTVDCRLPTLSKRMLGLYFSDPVGTKEHILPSLCLLRYDYDFDPGEYGITKELLHSNDWDSHPHWIADREFLLCAPFESEKALLKWRMEDPDKRIHINYFCDKEAIIIDLNRYQATFKRLLELTDDPAMRANLVHQYQITCLDQIKRMKGALRSTNNRRDRWKIDDDQKKIRLWKQALIDSLDLF